MKREPVIEFGKEKDFQNFLLKELSNTEFEFIGRRRDRKGIKDNAQLLDVRREKKVRIGRNDIIIEHDHLDLAYDHALASPLLIELKTNKTWNEIQDVVKYKLNAHKKYNIADGKKWMQVVYCTPDFYFNGSHPYDLSTLKDVWDDKDKNEVFDITKRWTLKRALWKLGIGVLEWNTVNKRHEIVFNEQDVIWVK